MAKLRGRVIKIFMVAVLFLAVASYSGRLVPQGHSLTSSISAVYVDPVQSCCILPNSSSTRVVVNIMMNLAAGQSINGFDIRLNYSNYWTPVLSSGVLLADKNEGFNFTNNIFAGRSPYTPAACIDFQVVYTNAICGNDDAVIGQVHFSQIVTGPLISGPLQAQFLFSVTFNVMGIGSSLFTIERAHLLNPGDNSQQSSPQFVQTVTGAGIFGNTPVVGFFDYSPQNPPSILAGDSTTLDASASFRSTRGGLVQLSQPAFSWSFGDGTANQTGATITHQFPLQGNYTVRIAVSDASGQKGSFERVVPVSPALGVLEVVVKSAKGGSIVGNVIVQVHNSSTGSPLCAKCIGGINAGGIVYFHGLSPGLYNLTLSGPNVLPASQQAQVYAGWTSQSWVYMTPITIPLPDTTIFLILTLVTAAAVGVVGVVLFLQKRSRKRMRVNDLTRAKKPRLGRR